MEWEGQLPSHLLLNEVSEIERTSEKISQRELSLFTSKARRALGLDGDLSVRITSARELQDLNRRFRHQNKATDVLSFPSLLDGGGDIAIARKIAAANATTLGHSLTTELKILILHGLLHLAGFDHESDHGEMTARESELRRELGLPFGLIERTNKLQVPRGLKPSRDDKSRENDTPKRAGTAQLKLHPFKAVPLNLETALPEKSAQSPKRGGRRA
jgi:probable rRNA maturation factor